MPTKNHNILLNRAFQYLGIILVMAAMGGGYWYWKEAQAGVEISDQTGKGMVGYFPLDEGIGSTTVNAATKATGAMNLSPTWTSGKVGNAMNFSVGSNVQYSCSNGGCPGYPLSVSLWVNPNSTTGTGLIWGMNNGSISQTIMMSPDYVDLTTGGVLRGISISEFPVGTWTHLVVVYTNSTTVTGYVNGVDKTVAGNDWWAFSCSGSMYLGARVGACNGNRYYDGKLDDVRIYNKALSVTEIREIYDVATKSVGGKVNSADSQGDSLEKGMVGYWKLDDASGTSATDSSGNANTGTLVGGPTWTTGHIGGATNFDGTDDYISTTTSYGNASTLKVFTLSSWFKTSMASGHKIVGLENYQTGVSTGNDRDIYIGTDGKIYFRIFDVVNKYAISSGTYADGNWHHAIGVSSGDGTDIKLYIDGVLQQTTSIGTMYTGYATSYWRIGSYKLNACTNGYDGYFIGQIDEVRVYNRALSAEEIAKLYKTTAPDDPDTGLVGYWPFDGNDISGTTAYDRSGNANNGTLQNSPTRAIGKIGQGLRFDGTDDYITIPNSSSLNPASSITVSTWIYLTSPILAGDTSILYKSDSTWGLRFFSGNQLDLVVAGVNNQSDAGFASTNVWIHVVGTYDGSNVKLYKDGVLVKTIALTGAIGADSSPVYMGYKIGNFFPGIIDEPRIYNRALSASEIWDLYQAGAADKVNSAESQGDSLEKGMVGYWKLDDASGGSAVDSSGNAITGTLQNSPTWANGRINGGLTLNGADQYVSQVANPTLNNLKNNFSVSAWVNPSSLPAGVSSVLGCSAGSGFRFGFYSSGKLTFTTFGVNDYSTTSSVMPSAGAWYHLTAVMRNNDVTFYKDGVPVQTVSHTSGGSNCTGSYRVGSSYYSEYMPGTVDEVRVYDRPLSAEEVAELYKTTAPDDPDTGLVGYWPFNGPDLSGTTAYDRSGKGNNGTLTNSPTRAIGKIGQGMRFDGSNDYIDAGSATDLDDIFSGGGSISAWVRASSWTGTESIIEKSGTTNGFFLYHSGPPNSASTQIRFQRMFGTTLGRWNSPGSIFNRGEWFHVVVTYDDASVSNDPSLYVNGVSQSLSEASTPSGSYLSDAASNLKIGEASDSSIDEVRIYDRALTQAEVTALYNASR